MKVKDGFVLTEVGDDIVAVPTGDAGEEFHGIIRLNDTAAFIWRGVSEGLTAEQIAERMCSEYDGVDIDTALDCTRTMIEKLKSDGIMED